MSRRRYVYTSGGVPLPAPVEVSDDWRNHAGPSLRSEAEVYGGLQAQDGTPIDSRRRHREYMASRGLAMADDFTETWARADKERKATLRGESPAYERQLTEDVRRTYQQLSENPRRR